MIDTEFLHPNYDKKQGAASSYDIALLKLEDEVDLSKHTPACMPIREGVNHYVNMTAVMLGGYF